MSFALFLCCANLEKRTKKTRTVWFLGKQSDWKGQRVMLGICIKAGLFLCLFVLFFFLSPVKPVQLTVLKKLYNKSWQFSFLLLLCASCLLSTKHLRWGPECRGCHDSDLFLLAVVGLCHKRSNTGDHPAARVCTVSQNNNIVALYIFKKSLPVPSECDARITHLASHGLDYKGTAQCL